MPEDQDNIESLLRQADQAAGSPLPVSVSLPVLRRRVRRRRALIAAAPLTAAAVLLITFAIPRQTAQSPAPPADNRRIASLENQIKQLQATTDSALALISEVLEDERKQRRLESLQAQLASIPDPLEEIRRQTDKTAFILVYQADRLYFELNQTESAIEAYDQVIRLFPENRWANEARQRIEDIKSKKLNKSNLQGVPKWILQKEPS